ncbi:MAG TPA: 4-hydroxyphenylacetate 3-hydroxylase N-terminal domain-containing protein [Acidimicrobiia bacterium]|jgi:aromatic ring hydroxylase
MGLRTADEYRASLRDGRVLWYRGARVPCVLDDADLRVAVDHSAIDFEASHDAAHEPLAVAIDPDTGERYSAYYRIPRSTDDLLARMALVERTTALGGTLLSIKDVGSDAMFALLGVLQDEDLVRLRAFYERVRRDDLAVAVAQTDVKGDRTKAPHEQSDPDLHVHVVDRSDEGIVVRGAKVHTSLTPNCNEILVLPTRAMRAEDADYAIAFAVEPSTPGLSMYVSPYSAGDRHPWEYPASSKHKMLETLTVFDDVFVPWERVFCFRRPELAGPIALAFVEYHRFTAVSYKLPLLDAFVGCAAEIARMNGVIGASHIRDKLTHLVIYNETVRTLIEAAARRGRVGPDGYCRPDSATTNIAKYTFATGFHEAVRTVQDCAGGLLATGPGGADWDNPEIRPVLEKYFAAAAPAGERLAMINLISDLTVREFGGYHAVLAVHAEGSIEAEKMQIFRAYDGSRAIGFARHLAGLHDD